MGASTSGAPLTGLARLRKGGIITEAKQNAKLAIQNAKAASGAAAQQNAGSKSPMKAKANPVAGGSGAPPADDRPWNRQTIRKQSPDSRVSGATINPSQRGAGAAPGDDSLQRQPAGQRQPFTDTRASVDITNPSQGGAGAAPGGQSIWTHEKWTSHLPADRGMSSGSSSSSMSSGAGTPPGMKHK
ncbi:hypothetical protein CDD82_6153 [Ophiocordyceps australis]|uniref:Uncharacterized protein n=1 Tax=Ophiocordyceps australis TaxID=1399860 RepID=A0A2C5YWA5_9HYPO|nr:hypothetical protein CDD82_6153 [Ophiocordyceps australis]